jgi:hypothetical protein
MGFAALPPQSITPTTPMDKSFLLLFFKKEALPFLPDAPRP